MLVELIRFSTAKQNIFAGWFSFVAHLSLSFGSGTTALLLQCLQQRKK